MTYNELVHTLRAIYNILLQEKYIQPQQIPLITIVGSQSILCCYSYTNEIPAELLRSNEIDLFYDPYEDGTEEYEVSEILSGNLGEGTMFHDRYNYYVDGIHVENLILPTKWYERTYLETIEFQDECGQCVAVRFLAPADAVAAKIKAGRRKDIIFIQELKDSGLINDDEVLNSIYDLPISFQEAEKLWEMYDNIKKLPNQGW